MKKIISMIIAAGMMAGLTACGKTASDAAGDQINGRISLVSREDGSGTRGAFVELFGIEQKNAAGEKEDYTTEDAEITNSTSVMMTTIAGNKRALGYISLGSLNDTVKPLKIDGAAASADTIKSGEYKIARPFSIVVREAVSDKVMDFISFINSQEGQMVVEGNGYISPGNSGAYVPSGVSGKLVIAGSSSVTPVMEKLKEAYAAVNPDVKVEIQQSDSTTGVSSVIDGISDIGMISRGLKDSELASGLTQAVIALDGIAVIVNHENPASDLSSDMVKAIFTGEIGDWADVQ